MQSLSQYLAAALTNGTRKQFSRLMADYLETTHMAQSVQHPLTDAQIAEQKRNEQTALLTRIAELEARVTELEGRQ